MVGRTKQFDVDDVIEIAMHLFWDNGCRATSLQDLLDATGLSKSSFYQTFGGKHQLFQLCLNRYEDDLIESLRSQLEHAESGRSFIESVLVGVANETHGRPSRRGCLIMNTASEFGQTDPVIAKSVKHGKRGLQRIYLQAIERARQAHEISTELDANLLAEYLVTCTTGLKTMVKAGNSKKSIRQITDVMLGALDHSAI